DGLRRIAPTLKLSNFVELFGHHQFKYGADAAFDTYDSTKYYSGGQLFNEYSASNGGGSRTGLYATFSGAPVTEVFEGVRGFGHGSPGASTTPQLAANAPPGYYDFADADLARTVKNQSFAEFIQDTWSVADKVVLDLGVRFEQQKISPADRVLNGQGVAIDPITINLNNVMPRIGVIYDWTGRGLSKVYASFGRFYEYVPLDLADRSLSIESSTNYATSPASCTRSMNSKAGSQAFDPRSCALLDASNIFGSVYGINGYGLGVDPNI